MTLFATPTANLTAAASVAAANMVTLSPGATKVVGVPGYTKTNKYRVFGDIAKVRVDFGFGAITAGAWLEFSNTYRQQRDVNLLTGARNYAEGAKADPVTKAATPQDIKFDQKSHTNHTEEFVELELRPIPGLKITPGFKHVDFNRQVDALYNQTTRIPQRQSKTYTADLPFATINYAFTGRLSAYGQYARGFLAPPLSQLYVVNPRFSNAVAERSTNYQAGAVYHGRNLSLDLDVYKIDFTNKFAQDLTAPASEGTVFTNIGAVQYKGVEGQVTYALPRGFAVFANGSRNYAKKDNKGEPHTQVANAPEYTAAGGILYKDGPVRFSLIDKYTGRQWFLDGEDARYQSNGYNIAILSARYDIGPVRIGVQVENLFDSKRVTNINQNKLVTDSKTKAVSYPFDQYFYQTGRAFTGDITLTF